MDQNTTSNACKQTLLYIDGRGYISPAVILLAEELSSDEEAHHTFAPPKKKDAMVSLSADACYRWPELREVIMMMVS